MEVCLLILDGAIDPARYVCILEIRGCRQLAITKALDFPAIAQRPLFVSHDGGQPARAYAEIFCTATR